MAFIGLTVLFVSHLADFSKLQECHREMESYKT